LLRKQCRGATAISYVTETSLQKRYPPNPKAFQTHYSSIQLSADDYFLRSQYAFKQPIKLLCIGNLSQPYKGCDFMLHTLARLNAKGMNFQLRWIGGGHLQVSMQKLANELGLQQAVTFVGNLAERAEINKELDLADIFVLSSRQEGLPRVLIEAMARSLVCVATNVGGVCELLPSEFIVERDDQEQLSHLLSQVSQFEAAKLLRIGQANNLKAHSYENSALALRRISMYQHLLDAK
jgi:colanic acid/amylovoran biosynthesis glycosyltransferase